MEAWGGEGRGIGALAGPGLGGWGLLARRNVEGDFLARFKYVQDFTATATQLTLSGAFNFLNDVQLVVPSEPSKGILAVLRGHETK